jgi:hypothetical protein
MFINGHRRFEVAGCPREVELVQEEHNIYFVKYLMLVVMFHWTIVL